MTAAKTTTSDEKRQIAFRANTALVERVDRLANAMAAEDGGISPRRSGAIRRLILTALPLLESRHGVEERRAS
jgi:hypothetical protein